MEHVKELCCTWRGIGRVKNVVAAAVGVLVVLSSLFSVVNIITVLFEPLDFIRFVWNGMFGVLIVLMELNWRVARAPPASLGRTSPRTPVRTHAPDPRDTTLQPRATAGCPPCSLVRRLEWVTLRFGFLTGWFGRGMFFLYVGTVVMDPDASLSTALFSFVVGGGAIFVGCVELLVGFKCDGGAAGPAGQQRRAVQVRVARAIATERSKDITLLAPSLTFITTPSRLRMRAGR